MIEDEKRISTVYSRIPPSLERALNVACAERGVKRPNAIEEAIRQWVVAPTNAGTVSEAPDSVLKSEQTLTCPACQSRLSVRDGSSPEVLDDKSVPNSESPSHQDSTGGTLSPSGIAPEEEPWVRALLYVLRNARPQTVGAIMTNLVEFQDATKVYLELTRGGVVDIPEPPVPRRVPGEDTKAALQRVEGIVRHLETITRPPAKDSKAADKEPVPDKRVEEAGIPGRKRPKRRAG